MKPGTAHAVYTQSDCLGVGGHFYSAYTLSYSIDAVRLQILRQTEENENIGPGHFSNLTRLFTCWESIEDRFTPSAMARLEASVLQLLLDLGAVSALEDAVPDKRKKESRAHEQLTSRQGRVLYKPWYESGRRKPNADVWPEWLKQLRSDSVRDHEEGKDDAYYKCLMRFVRAACEWMAVQRPR